MFEKEFVLDVDEDDEGEDFYIDDDDEPPSLRLKELFCQVSSRANLLFLEFGDPIYSPGAKFESLMRLGATPGGSDTVLQVSGGTITEFPTRDGGRTITTRDVNGKESYTVVCDKDGRVIQSQSRDGYVWTRTDGDKWMANSNPPRSWKGKIEIVEGKLVETDERYTFTRLADGTKITTAHDAKYKCVERADGSTRVEKTLPSGNIEHTATDAKGKQVFRVTTGSDGVIPISVELRGEKLVPAGRNWWRASDEESARYIEFSLGPDGLIEKNSTITEKIEDNGKSSFVNHDGCSSPRSRLPKAELDRIVDGIIFFVSTEGKENLASLKDSLRDTERVALARGVSKEELERCYHEIGRLLSSDIGPGDKLLATDRVKLAVHLLANLKDPTLIDQGGKSTCAVASIEVCMYLREPSKAMRLVTDIALYGEFTTRDGTRIKIDDFSRKADREAQVLKTEDKSRNYASQLFHVAALNVHHQRESKGERHYRQVKPTSGDDLGERIWNREDGTYEAFKGLEMNHIPSIYEEIAGNRPSTVGIIHGDLEKSAPRGVSTFRSEAEFERLLNKLAVWKNLPVTIAVYSNMPGFDRPSRVLHAVTITGYDPVTKMVKVDNQWGRAKDHNRTGLPLHVLYMATHPDPLAGLREELEKLTK